jgi:hypothetical protein
MAVAASRQDNSRQRLRIPSVVHLGRASYADLEARRHDDPRTETATDPRIEESKTSTSGATDLGSWVAANFSVAAEMLGRQVAKIDLAVSGMVP